ncbi:MAG: hypothetical protein QOH35_1785 [Acidobacteriaceae bacterium]|jgi:uncharacterized protein (DUF433 family)|nr:hypothetical protein [Acidobacteriaceae bacterium]
MPFLKDYTFFAIWGGLGCQQSWGEYGAGPEVVSKDGEKEIDSREPHVRVGGLRWLAAWSGINKKGGPTMAGLDWSECPAIESIPGRVSGAWVLKGTRMPVSSIFENLEAGAIIDDIMEWYDGLDRDHVRAVIEFAARSLDKPPAYAS